MRTELYTSRPVTVALAAVRDEISLKSCTFGCLRFLEEKRWESEKAWHDNLMIILLCFAAAISKLTSLHQQTVERSVKIIGFHVF